MKTCVIQPPHRRDTSEADSMFAYKLNLLDQCDSSLDLIVLPKYSDVPFTTNTIEETLSLLCVLAFAEDRIICKDDTGGVYEINNHLWEGKYSPRDAHGKRISRNIYAKTREECEAKLAVMIVEMKREIAEEKGNL